MTQGEAFSGVKIDALSASRDRPQTRDQVEHRDPLEILDELRAIEVEILEEIGALADRMARSSRAMTGWGSMSCPA